MIRQTITISELKKQTDIDSDVVNDEYSSYDIIIDKKRKIRTTAGVISLPKNSIVRPQPYSNGCLNIMLITKHQRFLVDVDAGLFVFCDWLDIDDKDCYPTLTEIV